MLQATLNAIKNAASWVRPAALTIAVGILVGASAAQSAHAQGETSAAQVHRIAIWDGGHVKNVPTWVAPATSTFQPETDDEHDGKAALALKFDASNIWIGGGLDWFDWKAGRDVGTDTTGMTNLTLWIKSKSNATDLQLQLLCNGKVIDTPDHHTAKVDVLKYCPTALDGKWRKVVIPLADLTQPKGYDPKVVTMLDFGFMANGPVKGSLLFSDIAFDNSKP